MMQVFSSGGGTQSVAIAALIVQGRLPKPDCAVIVDTERERQVVWDYHHTYVEPALASVGVTIHRVPKSRYATVDLFGGKNGDSLLLPVFTNQSAGEPGKMPGFCSNEWKVRVLERFLREEHGIPTADQRRWIGFSLDEMKRALRMMKGADYAAGRVHFPLIEAVPMRRAQSIRFVMEEMGWPEPPRSACWNCPNQSDAEWISLPPDEFAAAVALEREFRKIDPFAWLHEECIPLDQVDFAAIALRKSAQGQLFERACDSGACFI